MLSLCCAVTSQLIDNLFLLGLTSQPRQQLCGIPVGKSAGRLHQIEKEVGAVFFGDVASAEHCGKFCFSDLVWKRHTRTIGNLFIQTFPAVSIHPVSPDFLI